MQLRIDQPHCLPRRVNVQQTRGDLGEVLEVRLIDRFEGAEGDERAGGPFDLEIDGRGHRARLLDVLRVDERLFLGAGGIRQPPGQDRQGNRRDEDERGEDAAEPDTPHAAVTV